MRDVRPVQTTHLSFGNEHLADLLESLSFHHAALAGSRSRTVRYWRGAASVELSATFGSTPVGFALSGGVVQSWQTNDILVSTSDLVLGGAAILPQLGDRVEATINGQLVRFIVAETDDQRTHRWHDGAGRERLRIHLREAPSF